MTRRLWTSACFMIGGVGLMLMIKLVAERTGLQSWLASFRGPTTVSIICASIIVFTIVTKFSMTRAIKAKYDDNLPLSRLLNSVFLFALTCLILLIIIGALM